MRTWESFRLIIALLAWATVMAACTSDVDDVDDVDDADDDDAPSTDDDDASIDDEPCPEASAFGFAPAPSDDIGLFVSAERGDDANPGTMASPMKTLTAALVWAHENNDGRVIFVAEGNYSESFQDARDDHVSVRRSVFGGYEARCWTRDLAGHETIVSAESARIEDAQDDSIVVLEGMTWRLTHDIHVETQAVIARTRVFGCSFPYESKVTEEWCSGVAIYSEEWVTLVQNEIVGSAFRDCDVCIGVYMSMSAVALVHNHIAAVAPGVAAGRSEAIADMSGWELLAINNVFTVGNSEGVSNGVQLSSGKIPMVYQLIRNFFPVPRAGDCLVELAGVWGDRHCYSNVEQPLPIWLDGQWDFVDNMQGDPRLEYDAEHGFRPLPDSPLIDAAIFLSDFPYPNTLEAYGITPDVLRWDIDGLPAPYHSFMDIGPYEWRPSPASP